MANIFYDLSPIIAAQKSEERESVTTENIDPKAISINADEIVNEIYRIFSSSKKGGKFRPDDPERTFFSKTNYILEHNFTAKSREDQKKGLFFLAADGDWASFDQDNFLRGRDRNINKLYYAEENKKNRMSTKDLNEKYMETVWESRSDRRKGGPEDELLKCVFRKIAEKERLLEWLLRPEFLGMTDENREEWKCQYQTDDEGYLDRNKEFPENDKKALQEFAEKRAIEYKQKKEFRDWLLDYQKMAKWLRKKLKKDEKDLGKYITVPFCKELVLIYLNEFFSMKKEDEMFQRETGHRNRKKSTIKVTPPNSSLLDFNWRYGKLQDLSAKATDKKKQKIFKNDYSHLREQIDNNIGEYWPYPYHDKKIDDFDMSRYIPECDAIQIFIDDVNIELSVRQAKDVFIRIHYLHQYMEKAKVQNASKCLLMLAMVLKCGDKLITEKWVRLGKKCSLKEAKFYKNHKDYNKEKLRCAEIKFIYTLQSIYKLSQEEKNQCWDEFFNCNGSEILSVEEAALWKKIIGANYESIPAIGIQLFFVECVEGCMSLHRDTLYTYKVGTAPWKKVYQVQMQENEQKNDKCITGYEMFLKQYENCKDFKWKEVSELVQILPYVDGLIDKFKSCLKKPQCPNEEYRKILLGYLDNFKDCEIMRQCPDNDYKLIELEVALRLYCIREAKNKMYKWFKDLYGQSLEYIVEERFIQRENIDT